MVHACELLIAIQTDKIRQLQAGGWSQESGQ
jgi:hypothetical protein